MQPTPRSLLGSALHDFRRTYTQLILTDLLARVLGVALIAPVIGLLLQFFLSQTSTGVVTDSAIVTFLLHPAGMAALLVVGAVSFAVLFAETSQLMVIGFGALEDRRVTWLDGLLYAARRAWICLRLAWFALLRLLVIIVPFLAALGLLFWLYVRQHDINYYLANKPPAFVTGLVVAGVLLTTMGVLVIAKIARWLLALPMVLFEPVGARAALRASEEATAPYARRLIVWLLGWVVGVLIVGGLVTFLVGWLGNLLIPRDASNLGLVLFMLTVVLALSFLANLAVSVLSTAFFPLLVVRLYRALAGPGALRPEISPRGSLGEGASHRLPGKGLVAIGVGVLFVLAVGAYFVLRDLDGEDHGDVIAHRGGAAVAPENTHAALQRGIEDGADWLEIDVQENADGEVVVIHDRDFMRIANSPLEVHRATNAKLADLDVGSFFAPEYADQRLPTLRETLEMAKGKAGVLIELKYYGYEQKLEERVVELVEAANSQAEIMVMSLSYEGLQRMKALRPDWTYGLLNAVSLGDLTKLDVDFLALTVPAATFSMIRRAHGRDLKVYVWTVDDPVQMSIMLSRGVDGLITDQVARAHEVREWRKELTPLGRIVVWLAGETGMLGDIDQGSDRDDA